MLKFEDPKGELLKTLNLEKEKLENILDFTKKQNESQQKQILDLTKKNKQLNDEITKLNENLANEKKSHNDTQQEYTNFQNEMQNKIKELNLDITQKQQRIDELSQENADLTKNLQQELLAQEQNVRAKINKYHDTMLSRISPIQSKNLKEINQLCSKLQEISQSVLQQIKDHLVNFNFQFQVDSQDLFKVKNEQDQQVQNNSTISQNKFQQRSQTIQLLTKSVSNISQNQTLNNQSTKNPLKKSELDQQQMQLIILMENIQARVKNFISKLDSEYIQDLNRRVKNQLNETQETIKENIQLFNDLIKQDVSSLKNDVPNDVVEMKRNQLLQSKITQYNLSNQNTIDIKDE